MLLGTLIGLYIAGIGIGAAIMISNSTTAYLVSGGYELYGWLDYILLLVWPLRLTLFAILFPIYSLLRLAKLAK